MYDEEIMAGWPLNDSDLNVKCNHCTAHLVPKLYVAIQDLDSIRQNFQNAERGGKSSEKPQEPHPFPDVDPILTNLNKQIEVSQM